MTIEDAARSVLQRLEDAWNAADGEAYGREYTKDARFVNIQGVLVVGADAIGAGHGHIFRTIYAGSVNQMKLIGVIPVSDGVIVVQSRNTLACPTGPLAGVHDAIVTAVLVRTGDDWRITASQTTLVTAAAQMAGAR